MDTGDIVERDTSASSPEPPKAKPARAFAKKWVPRRRPLVLDPTAKADAATKIDVPPPPKPSSDAPLSTEERIHLENIRKLQKMTPAEIQKERDEIMNNMNPAVLESLLRRAEKKQKESNPAALKEPTEPIVHARAPRGSLVDWDPSSQLVKPDALKSAQSEATQTAAREAAKTESVSKSEAANTKPEATRPEEASLPHTHFAPPPEELRQYFPDLPVETEKLAWMLPIGEDEEAEYSSQMVSLAPSELRFDFRGDLITPRRSRDIPVSEGLHHHGDAPSAAGYTLPELAHLARSVHPAQRAIAIQTVGRVLHKLRLNKFARSSELQEGLNALVKQTRILETLAEAADDSTRNLNVRTRAIEALWLARPDVAEKAEKAREGADQEQT